MIKISNASKRYEELEAVKNVNMQVNKGSIFGLVGSNGAGKTTLLKLLTGTYYPDGGVVQVADEDVFENSKVKSKILFINDQPYFFANYTIADMAVFYQSVYPQFNWERFTKMYDIFQIDTHKRIRTLSKGMQKQVSFWLAMSAMPELLLLDEPLDGLDPVMRKKVKNLIFQDVSARELTVVISSHNLRELEDFCDFIGIMHDGTVILQKDIDELRGSVNKIQMAFPQAGMPEGLKQALDILREDLVGSVYTVIVKGDQEKLRSTILAYQPLLLDMLPLTLEEIFIYEMEVHGYASQNIIF